MSGLLSIGVRAMFANQAALQAVGQNIANANTPGYSRQSVVLTTPEGQYTGAGYFGKGVTIQTVERSHNEFLTRQAAGSKSLAHMDSTRMSQLSQLEKIFPPGETGLGAAAGQFLNAMVDVSSRPSDPSARQVVMGRATEVAARFASAGQQLVELQSGVVSDLKANVDVVNQLSKQIAFANDQISRANGNGHTPNDLLDQRDKLISELSQYIQVSTLPATDGTLGVFIGGGQRLVLGAQAQELTVTQDPYDSQRAALSITDSGGPRSLDESVLTGGSISALLQYQNKDLQDARNMLGQMAAALASRVNDQQALGLDLSDPPGKGVPIFAFGAPRALPASTNARAPDGSFASDVTMTITNASQLQASAYRLETDPTGGGASYKLTRISDGYSQTVVNGDTVDGFRIDFSATPPGPGDSYILEPVAQAAVEMRRVLEQPTGIAAASPLTATTNVDNKGSTTVNSIYAVNDKFDASKLPISLAFGDPDPTNPAKLQYTLTLGDGSVLTGTWSAGQNIGNQPTAVPPIDLGFELSLNGVPRKDDTITLERTQFPATNNGNAKAFLNIQGEKFVGQRVRADGSIAVGATINEAYSATMSEIGSRVQGATYLSSVSVAVAAEAESTRAGQAGVNLDEEAARLMQYQQGYQAAAKVLQAAQSLFDELLRLAAR
ncbi:flagellar hook-associated protein FlgK [Paucibacter sp. DJ2R-2]|uniref:flagellar hook-associated protein FlgK n=1 Tax=Paucibacter sp. DJ2R-2 TaxID=2893558 RepID=UPI0021E4A1E2|nr:flagellar hook-associated protein FlgK [Paucibacter sp. DJ2R-2]MCV2423325.1 flagellar hook-associated protein FlgK [Paucibacter sp. DJ4R-1]MCV2438520.1 flagellar hook-associated protein FlgK [Paucibacter sp. DJ2R-2]